MRSRTLRWRFRVTSAWQQRPHHPEAPARVPTERHPGTRLGEQGSRIAASNDRDDAFISLLPWQPSPTAISKTCVKWTRKVGEADCWNLRTVRARPTRRARQACSSRPGPARRRAFGPSAWPALRGAVADLSWLLEPRLRAGLRPQTGRRSLVADRAAAKGREPVGVFGRCPRAPDGSQVAADAVAGKDW